MVKFSIVLALFFASIHESFAQETWGLVKDEQGIQVFVAKVANSDFKAFKAVMSVKTTEDRVLEILKDVNKYPDWFAYTKSVKLIKQSENEQQFSMETDYPWPYYNECSNYSMVFQKSGTGTHRINIVGSDEKASCKYSLKKANGYILLEPDKGDLRITYYFHSEPSQNIPAGLINPMIYRMPFETFIDLKKRFLD
ncbi:hypothetical protein D0X99_16720 [Algoriphagus lacus]|uniref:START domain-containing protein n=1 Tax=Algoriphagus lacus TaxID=2056311 RepID=A0A418PNS7_9BACT|nr:hypothetical protein [Algoriphagus lacus]RIW13413.1 hypothetical protein D0X99_16720 [Algoriphagus lacus]